MSRMRKFAVSAAWSHGHGQGVAYAVELVKWNQLVDGQINDVVYQVAGLVWVAWDEFVQARQMRQHVVVIAVVRLDDVQLRRAAVRVNAERVEHFDHLIRLLLIHRQYTMPSHSHGNDKQWQDSFNSNFPGQPVSRNQNVTILNIIGAKMMTVML